MGVDEDRGSPSSWGGEGEEPEVRLTMTGTSSALEISPQLGQIFAGTTGVGMEGSAGLRQAWACAALFNYKADRNRLSGQPGALSPSSSS